jgi:RNA methyltransferase, TrmH family
LNRDQPRVARNPAVIEAARLHRSRDRRERGKTLIEGPHLLIDAVEAGVAVDTVFALADDRVGIEIALGNRLEVVTVVPAAMARLSGTDSRSGPVSVIDIPAQSLPATGDLLVAHGVSDPGNLGTMIRTAAAFGWAVAHTPGTVDPWSPKTLRAGSGGHFKTSITPIPAIEALIGLTTVAGVARGGVVPAEVTGPRLALLVGDEASGLPAEVVARCDFRVSIPMPGGTESLNAAVATGILIHQLSGRARAAG